MSNPFARRLLALLLLVIAARAGSAQSLVAVEDAARFTFPAGHFHFELPLRSAAATSAQLSVDLLDTDDAVLSHASAACAVASGHGQCVIDLPPSKATTDRLDSVRSNISLLRVRYSVAAGGETIRGTLPLDRIAPELFELHAVVPHNVHLGGTFRARIRAMHPLTHQPRAGVPLVAELTANSTDNEKNNEAFLRQTIVTDSDGFASINFTVPSGADLAGVDLDVDGHLGNLHAGITQTLDIPSSERFELTTDKPLYQPGQTVHARMLVLDRNGHASAGQKVEVDVNDPDYTLVYRANAVTSAFGIATVDWPVPARMRLGEYALRAETAGHDRNATATVRLSRYDLPTFVVNPKPDRPFYLPGANANVDIRADYLFGKPVLHGKVRVVREQDREWNFAKQLYDVKEGKPVIGELDTAGRFIAHLNLAEDEKQYRDEAPSNHFKDLHFAAYVTDASTGRTEQRRFDIRIASQALHLYVTGESRHVRGLPDQAYVSVTTADGAPAACELTLLLLPHATEPGKLQQRIMHALSLKHLHTDPAGLVRIDLPTWEELQKVMPARPPGGKPAEEDNPTVYIQASDKSGHTGSQSIQFTRPPDAVRITTTRSVYVAGQTIEVALEATQPTLPLTVQLLRPTSRGPLTLATRDVKLVDGKASVTLPSDARFTGIVFITAAALGTKPAAEAESSDRYRYYDGQSDAQTTIATHAILFPRDNALHVGIRMDRATYRPGDQATAALAVQGPQDPDGDNTTPTPSALGLVAVDQAVAERNRTDQDFGGANSQSFFFHEFYAFEGSGSVGGVTLETLNQLPSEKPFPPGTQLAAEILLQNAHIQLSAENNASTDTLAQSFKPFFDAQLLAARDALLHYLDTHSELPTILPELAALLAPQHIDLLAMRDPWGTPYTLTLDPQSYGSFNLKLHSLGPDKQPGTADDFDVDLATWYWFTGRQLLLQRALNEHHARTGGYIRTLAALRSEMQLEGIPFDTWRDPWGQPFTYVFAVQQTRFAIEAQSPGDPELRKTAYGAGPFGVGNASISYNEDAQKRIGAALNRYAATQPFPGGLVQLRAALRPAGMALGQLFDPWGRPLYAVFSSHSFFTDRVHTEVHATPGSAPLNRTIVTPVTAVSDVLELRSFGPDGKRNTADDFVFATFSKVRAQQSAHEATPQRIARGTVLTGRTGDLSGTITDPSGAVIVGAKVLATSLTTHSVYEARTDSTGSYLLGPIPAGKYSLRVTCAGFMDLVYEEVNVLAKDVVTLNASLNVGSVSDTVSVTAAGVTLDTQNASVATVKMAPPPPPPPPPSPILLAKEGSTGGVRGGIIGNAEPTATPRLRDYFPETLVWRPEIITAADGTATLHFPVADNITTWQVAAAASTSEGNTGSGTAEFRTFLPFFAAFDPARVLTTGDSIALPITLRNYLDHPVSVRSTLTPAPWFRMESAPALITPVPAGESTSPVFRFTATAPATDAEQEFTATASETGDRIARPVTVHPDGEESAVTTAGILSPGETTLSLTLPADTLQGTATATLKLYPNLGAHLRDALAGMVAYPNGCAEQILSIAWPSLLLQRYAAALPTPDPKLAAQTHLYLQEAYENLLANQLSSGGFAYWQRDPRADSALTAYAVQFLTAVKPFIAVDDGVINKAIAWLGNQQTKDGLWLRVDRDGKPHPEDRAANAMLTAAVAAMLAGAPGTDPLLKKALTVLQPFASEFNEPYTLAGYALAALAVNDTTRSTAALQRLRTLALTENSGAYWKLETNTPFFGWGRAGRVESTAQVLRALLASGATPQDDLVARGLLFLDHEQDRHSLWYSTQATARVLDVLAAMALGAPQGQQGSGSPGTLSISVDGHPATTLPLPPAAQDAGPISVPLGNTLSAGEHRLTLTLPPGSQLATAQVVANFYRPWPAVATVSSVTNNEQLRLAVRFSTTTPAIGKPVLATAHIERLGFRGYGMMIAELGLPPGADVDRASLEAAVAASGFQLNHYEVLPDRLLVYVWPRAGGLDLRFSFTLRYGVRALTAPSVLYDYYNPDARFDLQPTRFESREPREHGPEPH